MKPVIFLVHTDLITMRRFLLVADELLRLDVSSIFINLTPQSRINTIKLLKNYNNNTNIECHNLCMPLWKRYLHRMISKLFGFRFQKPFSAIDKFQTTEIKERYSPEQLTTFFGFDINIALSSYYKQQKYWWTVNLRHAYQILRNLDPMAVVFSLEALEQTRIILLQCLRMGIPTVSMQHAEGFCAQYKNLPLLADHYISYSPYNTEILRDMGVKENHIHLTGNPDTDRICNVNRASVKHELSQSCRLSFNRRVLLVALRPSYAGTCLSQNIALIELIKKELGGAEDITVLIKPHNSDITANLSLGDYSSNTKNVHIINADIPISNLMSVSHYLLTHMSSCVVEAILLRVIPIVIKSLDGAVWPPWDEYGVFESISAENIPDTIRNVRDGTFHFSCTEDNRSQFINKFRYRVDCKASNRVANKICQIASNYTS